MPEPPSPRATRPDLLATREDLDAALARFEANFCRTVRRQTLLMVILLTGWTLLLAVLARWLTH